MPRNNARPDDRDDSINNNTNGTLCPLRAIAPHLDPTLTKWRTH